MEHLFHDIAKLNALISLTTLSFSNSPYSELPSSTLNNSRTWLLVYMLVRKWAELSNGGLLDDPISRPQNN